MSTVITDVTHYIPTEKTGSDVFPRPPRDAGAPVQTVCLGKGLRVVMAVLESPRILLLRTAACFLTSMVMQELLAPQVHVPPLVSPPCYVFDKPHIT